MPNNLINLLSQPTQAMLDRGVQRSTTAIALCERLEGKCFGIETGIETLDVHFQVSNGSLQFHPKPVVDADAKLSGTPINIARLAGAEPEAIIREGHVKISGDAEVATGFWALLDIVRPDWEEELSHYTGDVIAHETGRALRGFAEWAGRARRSVGRSVAEYLTEESRDLVARTELEEFNSGVDVTAAAVDRFAAKLQLLRNQQSAA